MPDERFRHAFDHFCLFPNKPEPSILRTQSEKAITVGSHLPTLPMKSSLLPLSIKRPAFANPISLAVLSTGLLIAAVSTAWSQTTYTWIADGTGSFFSVTDEENWDPESVPTSADTIQFNADSITNKNPQITDSTFSVNTFLFSRASGQTSVLAGGTSGTLSVAGNLEHSGGSRLIFRDQSSSGFSATIGNLILNSGSTTELGFRNVASTDARAGLQNFTVNGTTTLGGQLTISNIGNVTREVSLGSLNMNGGTLNPIFGSAAGQGTTDGATNTINVSRLHGTGSIQGGKADATLTTTGIIRVNGTTDGTYSGTINNGLANNVLALVKEGSSTLTLSGANTYTGATTVTGGVLELAATGSIASSATTVSNTGTLLLSGGTAGSVTVNNGGTLAGSGNVAAVTINSGGILAIGNSPGTMTFGGDLILASGSISNFEINGFSGGTYDLASGADYTATFDGTLNLIFDPGFSIAGSVQIFDFMSYDGFFSDVTTSGLAAGYSATFDSTSGIVTVIPEPGMLSLLAGAVALFCVIRRVR